MRLISLKVKNFRVLKDAEINFPDRVIGIIGRNGAGKSSIIEAIAYALYGNPASRTGKDEIKSTFAKDDESCVVSLTFSINSEVYRIERSLIGKSSRAEVQLFRGVGSESVGVAETKNYIEQIVGLDWRGFLSSFLARQAELNALSDLPPAKRRDHIAGMLGISKLDKAIDKSKFDIKSYKEKVTVLENFISDKKLLLDKEAELTKRLNLLKPELDDMEGRTETAKTAFDKLTLEYQTMSKKQAGYLSLTSNLNNNKTNLEHLIKQIELKSLELKELRILQTQAAVLEKETTDLEILKHQQKLMLDNKVKLTEKNEIIAQQASISKELEQVESQLKEKNSLIDQIKNKLNNIPGSIDDEIDNLTTAIESSREQYSQLKANYNAFEKEQAGFEKQLGNIDELGSESICDRCQRPLGDDIADIRKHLENEVAKLDIEKVSISENLKKIANQGQGTKEKLQKAQQSIELRSKLTGEINSLTTVTDHLNDSLIDKIKQRDILLNRFEQVNEVNFDSDEYDKLTKKLTEIEKKQACLIEIRGMLTRLENLDKEIKSLIDRKNETESEQKNISQELERLSFDQAVFEKLTISFNREQAVFDELKLKKMELDKSYELIETELRGAKEQLQRFAASEKELDETRSKHFYGEKLSALFGIYRKYLIASIRPSLADLSSDLFNEMTENKYNLVELDENYNLRVMDQGMFYDVERFSGGEKDLANLCLRLAISTALTQSAGLDRSFIILDEVFGSQDNIRKGNILHALTKLKNRFPQILLITHIEDIKDGVEQIIQVLPAAGGYSEVVVSDTV